MIFASTRGDAPPNLVLTGVTFNIHHTTENLQQQKEVQHYKSLLDELHLCYNRLEQPKAQPGQGGSSMQVAIFQCGTYL